ncbi:MAG TPA: extracellular solute-binding protein [Myxococcaceae bacterium]|nr:extracellular solute-binding protein [Myxococcaceae bacterium]
MSKSSKVTRRSFIKAAGVGAAGLGAGLVLPKYAHAQKKKTLKILQWNHFVPGYDKWFNETYIKQWGAKNDTEVSVDNIDVKAINARAASEVSAQKGHDLFLFLSPPAVYEDQVIDHKEIYQEVEKRYNTKPIQLAIKSTYNPKTKKYFGFSDSFVPDPVNYRSDLWGEIGMTPDSWDDIRRGGKKIKDKTGIPVGIGQSAELDTAMAMRAVMFSFGASEQDENNQLILNSKNTLEAVKFVKAMYQETMTPEVLAWDPSSNNRAMLAGKASVVLNAISITRQAENDHMDIGDKILLAKAAKGPVRRMGLEHVMNVYVIWKFAENKEGAKKFLADYIGNFRQGFLASEFYNFPCFWNQVPDITKLLESDTKGKPVGKYKVLVDSLDWATNVGYPGYATAAIDECFTTWVINTMFAQASTEAMSPEDAIKEAEAKCKKIWAKWQEKKLI